MMVACGEEPEDPYIEDEPCLVVEVLSPSSQSTDRQGEAHALSPDPERGGVPDRPPGD